VPPLRQHRGAQLGHRRIARVADDDRLHLADAVQVAHPVRVRLAGVGEGGREVAGDLGLRRRDLCLPRRERAEEREREDDAGDGASQAARREQEHEVSDRVHGGWRRCPHVLCGAQEIASRSL
jgi:hypothetical protein